MTTPDKATITPGMTTITGAPEASLAPGRGSPLRGLAARSSWLGATLLVVVAAACGGATPTAVTGPDSGPGGGTGVTPAATSLAGDEAPSPVPAPIPALPLAPASIATPRGVPSPTAVALSTTAPAIETAGPDLTPPITVDVTPPPSPGPLEAATPTPTALPVVGHRNRHAHRNFPSSNTHRLQTHVSRCGHSHVCSGHTRSLTHIHRSPDTVANTRSAADQRPDRVCFLRWRRADLRSGRIR